jgi:hypothetical protein
MALDEGIEFAVLDGIGEDLVIVIDIVRDELTRALASPVPPGWRRPPLNASIRAG